MTKRLVTAFIALMLVAAACGGSDTGSTDSAAAAPTTAASAGESQDSEDSPTDTTAAEPSEAEAPSGERLATLTLDNGEVFDFSILCGLEPQESAGQEILFTLVSYDKPYGLDVTQFGDNSFSGLATISLYDAETYDTVWEANTILGSDITLTLNGNTVTGSGTFFEEGDLGGTQVHGELEADC